MNMSPRGIPTMDMMAFAVEFSLSIATPPVAARLGPSSLVPFSDLLASERHQTAFLITQSDMSKARGSLWKLWSSSSWQPPPF